MGAVSSSLGERTDEEKIWRAARYGYEGILVRYRASVTEETRSWMEYRGPKGRTALMVAAQYGHQRCVKILLECGAQCNAHDSIFGRTALHFAAIYARPDIVQHLLADSRCNIYQCDTSMGRNALDACRAQYAVEAKDRLLMCLRILEEKSCLHTGFLFYSAENLLSRASGLSMLRGWRNVSCSVHETGDPNFLELALYTISSDDNRQRPSLPEHCLYYDVRKGAEEESDSGWIMKKFAFQLKASNKGSGASRSSDSFSMQLLAAHDEAMYARWLRFFQERRDLIEMAGISDGGRQMQEDSAFAAELSRLLNEESCTPPVPTAPALPEGDECSICFNGTPNAACIPCGHNMACFECLEQVKNTSGLCPVCRKEMRGVLRIYKA